METNPRGDVVLRDERGRLLPGSTANPGGRSKYGREFKEMCEHVLMNNGWDRWFEALNNEKTPPIVVHAMVEWLHAVVHGKPGVRKDEAGPSVEDLKNLLPTIVFRQAERLKEQGYDVPKNVEPPEEEDK